MQKSPKDLVSIKVKNGRRRQRTGEAGKISRKISKREKKLIYPLKKI